MVGFGSLKKGWVVSKALEEFMARDVSKRGLIIDCSRHEPYVPRSVLHRSPTDPTQVGFWFSEEEPFLPFPKAQRKPDPGAALVLAHLAQVEGAILAGLLGTHENYRGWSSCRLCGGSNGSSTFIAGGWEWPSGLAHYVQAHHLRLPSAFSTWLAEAAPSDLVQGVTPRPVPEVKGVIGHWLRAPSWLTRCRLAARNEQNRRLSPETRIARKIMKRMRGLDGL